MKEPEPEKIPLDEAAPPDAEVLRRARLKQTGCVVWFTGLPGSGKTTLARALEQELTLRGRVAFALDGDVMREGLCRDLGFTLEERNENIRRAAEVARLFAECGVICIPAFISPLQAARDEARRIIGADRFFEIHLSTDVSVCERRDVKGMYRKARAGEIPEFTGVSSPYEPPTDPAMRLDTDALEVTACVDRIVSLLSDRGVLAH